MLLNIRRRLSAIVDQLPMRAQAALVAHQLKSKSVYSFTQDYISGHAADWTAALEIYRGRPDLRMLEIGSLEGRSAIWFLEHVLTHPTATIVCLDPWVLPARELRFDHNLRIAGLAGKVAKLKGRSEDLLSALPRESFDIVYVDGCHLALNVLFDAVSAWLLLKPGGLLIFDDYLWETAKPPSQRPQLAIDLFLESLHGRYDLLSRGYQVILRKPAPSSPR